MTIVVDFKNVEKNYTLYPSHISMALDWAGYYKACFWKHRPDFPIKRALNGVSVQIRRGDRIGIIGRNGAGKTTLLKLAAGMISPTAGKIDVNGKIQVLMRLGAAFHPDFSGGENIRHSLLYNGLRGKALDRAFDEVADFVELGDFLHQPMRTYSMGMATRLQFAVATSITPDILIIDEMLGAGDAYFAAKSADRMRSLTRSGCTLLLVSHARAQIMEFCTSALWMDQGRVREYGDLEKVTAAYDKAIAESIAGGKQDQEISGGILPIPGHMQGIAYLNNIRGHIEEIDRRLVWKKSTHAFSQIDGAPEPGSDVFIQNVEMRMGENPTNYCSTGDELVIHLNLRRQSGDSGQKVRCRVMIFANGGDYIGDLCSSDLQIAGQGTEASLMLKPVTLGHRDYLLAVLLEVNGKISHVVAGQYLKIMETNDSDPPLLHYPAKWYQNAGENPVPARISGIQ